MYSCTNTDPLIECTHARTHAPTHTHAYTHTHTMNTYLHLRTRGCYSTDGIRGNDLHHVIELLSLSVCHLLSLCDLKFILFPNKFSSATLALVNLSNSDFYNKGT